MCNQLLDAFTKGRESMLEDSPLAPCPYLATSDLADAWHAGRTFERRRPTDFVLRDVRHGRGTTVHAIAGAPFGRVRKLSYVVGYGAVATMATETPASADAWR